MAMSPKRVWRGSDGTRYDLGHWTLDPRELRPEARSAAPSAAPTAETYARVAQIAETGAHDRPYRARCNRSQVLELGMPGLPGWDAAELAVGEAVNEWRYSTQSIQYVLLPLLQPIPTFRRLSSSPRPAPYEKRYSIAILDCALLVLQGEVACCAARLCG